MFVEVLADDGGRRGRGRYYSPEAHGEDVIGCIAVLGASQVRDRKANRQSWVARAVGGGRWEMRSGRCSWARTGEGATGDAQNQVSASGVIAAQLSARRDFAMQRIH